MRVCSKLICVALLLAVGISAGFGWGTVTHVYFANHLGVKFGTLNQNEIYGATLNDLFGYDFTAPGFTADYALHTSSDFLWGLYGAAQSAQAKAGFYGAFTHNNINDPKLAYMRGADWYAHGVYPLPTESPDPNGWVIHQGMVLAANKKISDYIVTLVGPQLAPTFSVVVGHTLIETAIDILVRRYEDPLVGARLILGARNRSNEIPNVLAGAVGALPGSYPPAVVLAVESGWRQQMIQYGEMFLLPEPKLIAAISQQTAVVGQMFLEQAFGIVPAPTIDPAKIAEFIQLAIDQVRPIYHAEIMATLCHVEQNMKNGPPVTGPLFACWKDGAPQNEFAEFRPPAEAPAAFALDQNYPNPFNPATTIQYAIPVDSRVTLTVYNSIGQEIARLVDNDMPAGRYSAIWNAAGAASGTYFYRMHAGNTVLTGRMLLMK